MKNIVLTFASFLVASSSFASEMWRCCPDDTNPLMVERAAPCAEENAKKDFFLKLKDKSLASTWMSGTTAKAQSAMVYEAGSEANWDSFSIKFTEQVSKTTGGYLHQVYQNGERDHNVSIEQIITADRSVEIYVSVGKDDYSCKLIASK